MIGRNSVSQQLAGAGQPDPGGWRSRAACKDLDPEWFVTRGPRHDLRALSYCYGCPVRRSCRDFILDTPASPPVSRLIAGGWIWDRKGKIVHTHPSDDRVEVVKAARQRAKERRAAARIIARAAASRRQKRSVAA